MEYVANADAIVNDSATETQETVDTGGGLFGRGLRQRALEEVRSNSEAKRAAFEAAARASAADVDPELGRVWSVLQRIPAAFDEWASATQLIRRHLRFRQDADGAAWRLAARWVKEHRPADDKFADRTPDDHWEFAGITDVSPLDIDELVDRLERRAQEIENKAAEAADARMRAHARAAAESEKDSETEAEPRGYQGTVREDEQIDDALCAISADPLTHRIVARALRAYYGEDKSEAGWKRFHAWYKGNLPDIEPTPAAMGLGAAAFPSEEPEVIWETTPALPDDGRNSTTVIPGGRAIRLSVLLFELSRLAKRSGPINAWPETETVYSKNKEENGKVIAAKPISNSRPNVVWLLQRLKVRVYWDEFSRRYKVEGFRRYTDLDEQARRALWFRAKALGLATSEEFFKAAVLDIAASDRRHPVREYLGSVKWDDQSRVGNWLSTYLGAEDNIYTRAVGKLFLAAAVRRVRYPGVKYDFVMVLVGPQNAGKSSAGAALMPADHQNWFEDGLILGSETKIVLEQTAGKWIVEINEMRGGKETEAIKAMITRTHDTARKAYGEDAVTVPRQFVMLGTTDKDEFLNDPAGNRRYLPVTIGKIDLEGLRRDRDQLWAEAAVIEASNEIPRLVLPPDVVDAAKEAQRKREMTDPIYEAIAAVLSNHGGQIGMETLYAIIGSERVSSRDPQHWQIKSAMTRLGWKRKRLRADGDRQYVYTKETGTQFRWWHKPDQGGGQALVFADPPLFNGENQAVTARVTPMYTRRGAGT